ncbi:MAG TPA: Rid family detoxifying hydrolase [Gemmatimonadales bacterium]|nr:Rid family detoxifying hydrolase [Gemmatimonadales bacterium]
MREPVVTDALAPVLGPFSAGVKSGKSLYSSGQVAQDPATGLLIKGGIVEQTGQALANVEAVLRAGGKTLADVVKVNVYLTDMRDFQSMNQVYATRFEKPYPARTTIAVSALPLGAAVEIDVVAE